MEKINVVKDKVHEEMARDIIKKWAKENKFSGFRFKGFGSTYLPFYFCASTCTIKRAFRLPPRVIPQKWLLDATRGKIYRVGEDVWGEEQLMDNSHVLAYRFSSQGAQDRVHKEALKHAVRFYKFAWTPEITVDNATPLYIRFWLIRWEDGGGKEFYQGVNAYSGDVQKIH